LLIEILTAQLPATADAESTMTTRLVDAMLHAEAAMAQTVALQLCEPSKKLLPVKVTVLPAYAAEGDADVMVGALLICSIVDELVALLDGGFENMTTAPQLPALNDPAATITILVPSTMEQLAAATPHMAAEHTWVLDMKLLPVKVSVLPAYNDAGSAETTEGAPTTVRNAGVLVAIAVAGLLDFTTTTQLPATADAESTMTTRLLDTMLHVEAAMAQTVALQLCEPNTKLLPVKVTVLPAYATEGDAEVMLGEGLIMIVTLGFSTE